MKYIFIFSPPFFSFIAFYKPTRRLFFISGNRFVISDSEKHTVNYFLIMILLIISYYRFLPIKDSFPPLGG